MQHMHGSSLDGGKFRHVSVDLRTLPELTQRRH